jgi:autotransporter-associated beta strand protein
MKGLTTSADYVIHVGGTGFFIEGTVKTAQGNPLAGVVVTASPTTGSPTTDTSDATGRYTITGLAAGSYTLTVSSGTPDGFTNPVTIGPSLQDRNFVRQSSSLTWDGNASLAGAQDGVGTWTNGAGKWWNQTTGANTLWSNTGLDSATFGAGTDGTYEVTLSGTVQASGGISFVNSGYTLSGSALSLVNGSLDGAITVAAGKTATINSTITYANNAAASITVNSGAVLNLGGGASNSQYNFLGTGGTVNMTAGTYTANIGSMTVATFNKTGGTFNITPGNNNGYNISSNNRNVNFTLSGGILTVNGNASTATVNNAYLGIGNGTAISNTSTMTVKSGATVNVGTTATTSGEIRISNTPESNGTLDVQSGTLTVGTGSAANKIYFFKAGTIDAPYLARMSQSGGTVTANGIQFGGGTGTYDAASSAVLQLSGGSLYVGAQGITRGSAAVDLAVAIQLQGGIIGASDTWSSSLNMQLGTTGGGPVFQAASSGGISKNITLSGILSDDSAVDDSPVDDSAVNGTLTKTGTGTLTLSNANTFTGATTVKAGALVLGNAAAVSHSSSLTIANGAALSLTTTPSTVKTLTFTNTGTLNFGLAGGGTGLTVNTSNGVTNSGAAGSIVINITGTAPANGTYTLISYSGALGGSGFSAYTLGTAPLGKSYTLSDSGSAVQLLVSNAYFWTGLQGSGWTTATIAAPKNWVLDAIAVDYTNGLAVVFDNTPTNKTVEITGTDVTPLSVAFNSGAYTLQGSNTIAGPAPVTVASGATLKLGSSNVLPDGAGAGNVTINGTLDLNGKSDTINALTGSGSVDNTLTATTSTLTVGANASGTFPGTLKNTVGTLALTKTGNTDFILSGTNTYSGATTVNQNRLFISGSAAFSPNTAVTVNTGGSLILNASGTPTFNQSITLNSVSNLSLRQAATLSNVTLPTSGGVIFNNDDVPTQAISLASAVALSGDLNVQVGGGSGAPGIVTLTGILSGSGGSLTKIGSGTLTLGGANTFTGGVTLKNGTLESKTTPTTLGTGTVTMGGAGSTGATFITGQPNSNPFVINAPISGSFVIGANGAGSGFTMSGPITLNGNLTFQTFNNTISGTTKATANLTGGITGTGNLLLNNLGLAANTISINTATVNHAGTITLQGTAAGDTTISAAIGSNVTGITQNSATSLMILSGENTYPGNLTVNAGLVRLSNAPDPLNANPGNDASTVTIAATGATLDLTYTGTDKVDKLVIDSTPQANGVYGKIGSASPLIGISQITGNGTLTVGTATPAGFSSWITGIFVNGTVPSGQQGANDDFDKDGISNLIEYAIAGQDPTVGNPAIGTFNAGTLSFTKREGTSGLTYDIESSTLLTAESWTTLVKPPVVESASVISYTFTLGTPVKNFARLKVTQLP